MFLGEELVAVLVRIEGTYDDLDLTGHWFLEAGFGRCAGKQNPTFADLNTAVHWIEERLASQTPAV